MATILVNPTGRSDEAESSLAPRKFRDLDGKTVALLNSTKHNSDRVLDALADLLEQRWSVRRVVRARKPTFARPVPDDQAQQLASQADIVLTGVGD